MTRGDVRSAGESADPRQRDCVLRSGRSRSLGAARVVQDARATCWPIRRSWSSSRRSPITRDVLFGRSSILPNLLVEPRHPSATTALTMLFAVPAAYALRPAALPAGKRPGFYVLATQMLPPVGLIIPYYLVLQKMGWLDTYAGMIDGLPHLLAAVRDLADGLLLRGHSARDGGGGAARPRRAAARRSGT